MNEYTPTTEQVRDVWIDRDGDNRPFDRWLAVEIRKAKAEALREAADEWFKIRPADVRVVNWLALWAEQVDLALWAEREIARVRNMEGL